MKVVIIAGLVLAFPGMVWAQHICNEAVPRELWAPSDAAVSPHQGRADFVLVEWEAVEVAAYYRLLREMPVREGADRQPEDDKLLMWVPWASIDAVPKSKRCRLSLDSGPVQNGLGCGSCDSRCRAGVALADRRGLLDGRTYADFGSGGRLGRSQGDTR